MPARITFSSWAAAAAVLLSALASPASAQDADAGQGIARENCARCHAITKTDASTHKQAPPFRQVVTRYPPASLAEALAEGISTGHPDMPEFVFTAEQTSDLIAYLETLQ
ncbi:MAG: cytochrome c [Rhizobiales bacterium]|nr:cytochrome c [Hyphomicrobiales bacterium]